MMQEYLTPTEFLDADHPVVRDFAQRATAGASTDRDRARQLFAAVRDGIRYNPFVMPVGRAGFRASAIAQVDSAFCVPKAILLVACARSLGIPARLAFADVVNHLTTPRLRELMGTDVFFWHGYAELNVDGTWRKASPAFNAELCARNGVPALEFDGTQDAVLHAFSGDGSRYMEYIAEHGSFADFPYDRFMEAFRTAYPGYADLMDDQAATA